MTYIDTRTEFGKSTHAWCGNKHNEGGVLRCSQHFQRLYVKDKQIKRKTASEPVANINVEALHNRGRDFCSVFCGMAETKKRRVEDERD